MRHLLLLAAAAALSNNAKLSSLRCQWTELRNAAPSGRSGAACASGPSGAWLFGGLDDQRAVLDDLWHFDPAPRGGMGLRWRAVDAAGGERPGPRLCAAAAVVGGDFVVFGGWDMAAKKTLDDCWAHDGAAWRRVGSLPAPCKNHVAVGLGDRAVVVADGATYVYADGVVESFPQPTGRAPSARTMAAAARVGDDVLVFGGVSDGVELGDAYVLDVARMDWREVRTTGASPGPRAGASAATARARRGARSRRAQRQTRARPAAACTPGRRSATSRAPTRRCRPAARAAGSRSSRRRGRAAAARRPTSPSSE